MTLTRELLISELPPYRDEWYMVKREQGVHDIINQMRRGYPLGMAQYDIIAHHFDGATVAEICNKLFDFCKENIEYREEGVEWQSNALPVAILTEGHCDCKGYANFIGGVLGALNRTAGAGIDWDFYYASYIVAQRTPYHVFVQVNTDDGPIWVDPTPGTEDKIPVWQVIGKVDDGGALGSMRVSPGGALHTVGSVVPGLDTGLAVASQVVELIPGGPLKSELKQLLSGDVIGAISKMISGYTYTGGDYALGEIFMNRVMGKQTSSRWDTPDPVIPVAWVYFTTLFGIPIAVNTDFDNIESGSLSQYLSGRPEMEGAITQEQVTRAKMLLDELGHSDKMIQWPPSSFGVLPYVAPIPAGRLPGELFNGTLPNGQQVQNGYPVTVATSGNSAVVPGGPRLTTGGGLASLLAGNGKYVVIGAAILLLVLLVNEDN